MLKREIHIFLTAVMFYTRIPCPRWIDHSDDKLNKSTRYFPFIGWIVGGIVALVYMGSHLIFPHIVSVVFSIISGVLLTGGFHEDGFADVCDGFGGGWTKQKILTIMKDSRIGAFGAIGLILMLGTKFALLASIDSSSLAFVMIAGHSYSRYATATFLFTHIYVRENDDSKIKPIGKKIRFAELCFACMLGTAPLLLLGNIYFFIIAAVVIITKEILALYFKKWIGGYTGDCLGATQQVCEVVFYASYLVIWKFI